ncbi:MAG: MoxR family ATPase [Lachnospiraceae bacterium]|nr:MoxR family ATPase [Lachnospiraceae bacterium]
MSYKIITDIIDNVEKVIVGKRGQIELALTAMIAGGHVLIEDVPGVGKTQLASAMAASCGGTFNRIQLTPDIMPSDITGFSLIKRDTGQMEFKEGAAFCNFLLADEINRCSPKSQSALLEIMEERQVSMDKIVHPLPSPFMILATQNPVETFGTYHLPEAQMDRFLIKFAMGYPDREQEKIIMKKGSDDLASSLGAVTDTGAVNAMIAECENVGCTGAIEDYIMNIVELTRNSADIKLGVSPRGSMALKRAAKAYAMVKGRDYVLPDDVKYLAPFVLSHRLMLSPQGSSKYADKAQAIRDILNVAVVV